MSVFNLNSLPKDKRIQMIGEFYDVINSLKDRSQVRLFFRDLLTPNEIAMLMRRLEVAVLLETGFTYKQVSELLNVGTPKIANIHKILLIDGNGYKIAIKNLLKNRKLRIKRNKGKDNFDQSPLKKMRKAYPGHFALLDLLDNLGEGLDKDLKKEKEAVLFTPSLNSKNKKISPDASTH